MKGCAPAIRELLFKIFEAITSCWSEGTNLANMASCRRHSACGFGELC